VAPDPQVPAKARSRTYTAAYKTRVLAEYESLDKAGKGALLRREGLYTSLISAWRQQRDQAGLAALAARRAGRRLTRPSGRTLGCAGRTSVYAPSWSGLGG
jgi:hypothetical protein